MTTYNSCGDWSILGPSRVDAGMAIDDISSRISYQLPPV